MAPRAVDKVSSTINAEDVPRPVSSPTRSTDDDSSSHYSSSNLVELTYGKDEFFDTSSLFDFSYEFGIITRFWNIIIGCSAILDFLAATVEIRFWDFFHGNNFVQFDAWLRENSFELGMVFSFLWFIDSFITATQIRNQSLLEAQKAALLRQDGWQEQVRNCQRNALVHFVSQILVQLLLLPVGFYVWISPGSEFRFTIEHDNGISDFDETERFTRHANQALIYALFHHATGVLSEELRHKAVHHGKLTWGADATSHYIFSSYIMISNIIGLVCREEKRLSLVTEGVTAPSPLCSVC